MALERSERKSVKKPSSDDDACKKIDKKTFMIGGQLVSLKDPDKNAPLVSVPRAKHKLRPVVKESELSTGESPSADGLKSDEVATTESCLQLESPDNHVASIPTAEEEEEEPETVLVSLPLRKRFCESVAISVGSYEEQEVSVVVRLPRAAPLEAEGTVRLAPALRPPPVSDAVSVRSTVRIPREALASYSRYRY